jgi:hypothetical protein
MGKYKQKNGQSRLAAIFKSDAATKIASFIMDALPIPNIINYLPDRNKDGKRDFKDFKWYEMAGSVAVLAILVKYGVINIDEVLKLLKVVMQYVE